MSNPAKSLQTEVATLQFEVTPGMLSDFCDAMSDFEVEGVAIPERFLSRVLQALGPHLARQIRDEIGVI